MDPSIGVASQAGLSHEALISAAAAADADFVELMMEGDGERRRLAERSDRIRAELPPSMDVLVHLPFGGVDPGAPLEHVRDGSLRELEANIDLAAELGAKKAVVHADSSVRPELWDADEVRSHVFDAVDELHAYGQRRSVEICVENVPGPFVSIENAPLLLDQTAVPLTIDTGHARVSGFDDDALADFVADHAPRISHFHVNDTRGQRDEHLPVGMGTIDFETVFGGLPEQWTGSMTVEALSSNFAYVETGLRRLRTLLA